jgi:hypothetical protein
MRAESNHYAEFSVFGGPLHSLGRRLGLVRQNSNATAAGFALGLTLWIVLVALAAIEGYVATIFSLDMIAGHVRLLVAIPLLFACEGYVAPRMATFVRSLVTTGVVRSDFDGSFTREIERMARLREGWLPDACCLVLAVIMSVTGPLLSLPHSSTSQAEVAIAQMTMTGWWYWLVCLTLFRFVLLRWIWRLGLWWYFLFRLSRMDLHLVSSHPDLAGGLGYLEVVHAEFTFIILAISAVLAATFAESILGGSMTLPALYAALALVLMLDLALFVAPLFVFAPKLWQSRVQGLDRYMIMASRYVEDFDSKWIRDADANRSTLLGTPDLQSMADLASSVDTVSNMRIAPVSKRLLIMFAVSAMLPMAPLAFLLYPGDDLAASLFKALLAF